MSDRKELLARLLGALFIAAGIAHFVRPQPLVRIVPAGLPKPLLLVYISGIFEILGGAGLAMRPTRRPAVLGLLALLAAVFPANINMAVNRLPLGDWVVPPVLLWLRLPMQGVLAAALLWCSRTQNKRDQG